MKKTYRDESGDLLAVLDELNTDTLPDSRVRLLGLYANLLKDDTLGVRRSTSGGGFVEVTKGALLVGFIRLNSSNHRSCTIRYTGEPAGDE